MAQSTPAVSPMAVMFNPRLSISHKSRIVAFGGGSARLRL